MSIWTYTENAEKKNVSLSLRGGGLILRIGTYANITDEEYNQVIDSGSGAVLKEGIVGPATPAGGGGGSGGTVTTVKVWTAKTLYLENQLVVSPEGELLRTLRNFESGETYVF
jgi:hypothetical protein